MDNIGFTVVGYVATFLLIGGYFWRLRQKLVRARREAAGPAPMGGGI